MPRDYHRPVQFTAAEFEAIQGGNDPALINRVAHETATALVHRVRTDPDPAVVERLVTYTDVHGIDALAELWARVGAHTLPGALWRIYLVRTLIRQNPDEVAYLFERGTEAVSTIDQAVAGAEQPTGPAEIVTLADEILRGLYTGDFAVALERGAAFCRLTAAGATSVADDADLTAEDRASELTRRALRLSELAEDLAAAAGLWRRDSLD
ncbi:MULTISPECIES: DNA-directed RNA polymerase subunit beta [unclassified Curtobacterium]|uniref:DNA-directed RNA polymerase subunit beta n=1 Tax=unclassified Curtobacterium TaxID=257496 RepID=UPI000DAA125A|nr:MULTISPECIES: DNA-directed RNA polymerase subunit beta [unclassified Curtobacterium]PZE27203.1 DNA-directed RNA polymerase subunit beta [Curtobacterium sp. MCBD17_028]PZE76078.1 DNA-directed RNA polymerase subunit beta [Curtobacterium sp. MCBD17_019]PZF56824.1 DNA-directed RNA polymerase subunit beta [Curtobacterium sp. MCBD17_013]PZF60278.1 DNA-directed RNA polymerase subunit beta [Curtobacterium sp. MCBD17_034]PZM34963.1 DNA-directed RNA polymerase subunit beta [Curtobacterium sp. MCBD17_